MSKHGIYDVSGGRPKDTSFRSFLCALLVFLVLLVIIYLALTLTGGGGDEIREGKNDKLNSDKQTAIYVVPDDTKEKETTTTTESSILVGLLETTSWRTTTTRRRDEDDNRIPLYDDERTTEPPRATTTTEKVHRKTTMRTTTRREDEDNNRLPLYEKTTEPPRATTTEKVHRKTTMRTTTRREDEDNNRLPLYDETTEPPRATTTTEKVHGRTTTSTIATSNAEGKTTTSQYKNSHNDTQELLGITTVWTETVTRGTTVAGNSDENITTESSADPSMTIENVSVDFGIDNELFHDWSTTPKNTGTTYEDVGLNAVIYPSTKEHYQQTTDYYSDESSTNTQTVNIPEITTENIVYTISKIENTSTLGHTTTGHPESTTDYLMSSTTTLSTVLLRESTTKEQNQPTTEDYTDQSWTNTKAVDIKESTTEDIAYTTSEIENTSRLDRTPTDNPESTTDYLMSSTVTLGTILMIESTSEALETTASQILESEIGSHTTDNLEASTKNRMSTVTNYDSRHTTKEDYASTTDASTTDGSTTDASIAGGSVFTSTSSTRTGNVNATTASTTDDSAAVVSTVSPLTTQPYTTPSTTKEDTTATVTTTVATTQKMSSTKAAHIPRKLAPPKECHSALCKRAASVMVGMMDHAADPCDNFYEFACGRSALETADDAFEEVNFRALLGYYLGNISDTSGKYLRDFRTFYESCVSHEAEFKYSDRMEFVADYPDYTLTELFVELILTQSMPLFDIGLDIGKDEKYKLQLTLPGKSQFKVDVQDWSLTEQIRRACFNELKFIKLNKDVDLDNMHDASKLCQAKKLNNTAWNFIEDMSEFVKNKQDSIYSKDNLRKMLTMLDEIQDTRPSSFAIREAHTNRDYKLLYHTDLSNMYSYVDWKSVLGNLTYNATFSETDAVDAYFSSYMEDTFRMIEKSYTEKELGDMLLLYSRLQLYVNTVIPKRRETREMYCMDLSRQLMPDIVSIIIYEIAHNTLNLNQEDLSISMLFWKLKARFKASLENSGIEELARKELIKKLGTIKLGIIATGNHNATATHYTDTDASVGEYQKNVVGLLRNYRRMVYSLEGTVASPSTLLTYFVDHFHSKPVSFYPSKFIVFHPAIFQRASKDLPEYLRLSKVGLHLSTELAKHFDPYGRTLFTDMSSISSSNSYYANLRLMTTNLLIMYANNTYSFEGRRLTFKANPNVLLNEMIVDNAALRLTYDTFVELKNQPNLPWVFSSYPIDKVFFITVAQEYCRKTSTADFMDDIYESHRLPSPVKIQNAMSNSKEFADSFQCLEGSSMRVPFELIAQFPYVTYNEYDYAYTNLDTS